MHKDRRLRQPALFNMIYSEGRTVATKEVVLYFLCLNNEADAKIGFSVSKKIGNAVVRNRTKRRLKNIVEQTAGKLKRGCLLILVARRTAPPSTFPELEKSVALLLKKAGAIEDRA